MKDDFNFEVVEFLQLLPALFLGHWGKTLFGTFLHTTIIIITILLLTINYQMNITLEIRNRCRLKGPGKTQSHAQLPSTPSIASLSFPYRCTRSTSTPLLSLECGTSLSSDRSTPGSLPPRTDTAKEVWWWFCWLLWFKRGKFPSSDIPWQLKNYIP